jgi:N6-L-threonylcarbamoyladenine synthase
MDDISAVAVTNEPGLSVTLHEGVMLAKVFSVFKKIPIVPVHHLKGHIYSLFIEKESTLPLLVLLISGGHTQILKVSSIEDMTIIATSMDDSVGESYDKVAKMMGLGYPGGPVVEKLALDGDPERFDLPVPLRNSGMIAFSLSGLKNAVRLTIESLGGKESMSLQDKRDLAASFQKTVISHLIQKSKKVFKQSTIENFAIVGGASANQAIRNAFEDLCRQYNKKFNAAELEYCSDNAAMIGRYAIDAIKLGMTCDHFDISVKPNRKVQSGDRL